MQEHLKNLNNSATSTGVVLGAGLIMPLPVTKIAKTCFFLDHFTLKNIQQIITTQLFH